jgi:hypothetical protein
MHDGGQAPSNDLGEDIPLIDMSGSIGERIANEQNAHNSGRTRGGDVIGAHSVMVNVRVDEESVDISGRGE